MCGIAGLVNLNGEPLENPTVAIDMADSLSHRGPDEGTYFTDGPVAFGFRRLSVIDLKTGTQPVSNADGTVSVIFNGEIYNYLELRTELESFGFKFKTHSDTEVIVHSYEAYGLDFLKKFRGMFAIALWDSRQKLLLLARDRVGKKPLFYSLRNNQLAFSSEIKALLKWPNLNRSIDARALDEYL